MDAHHCCAAAAAWHMCAPTVPVLAIISGTFIPLLNHCNTLTFSSHQVMTAYYRRLMVHKLPSEERIVSSFLPVGSCGKALCCVVVAIWAPGRRDILLSCCRHGCASSAEPG